MNSSTVDRRTFVKAAATTGAGLLVMPSGSLFGATAASNKLNIALLGAWGRGGAHHDFLESENVVALCDVNDECMAKGAKRFPKAKQYKDWRKCLDQKDLDAVLVCTPDHTHAHIASWAMNRDLHVYLEKPLGNCVHEARYVREKYLQKKSKLATQVGTQRHANENFARVRELIHDGAVGELKEAHAWGNRELHRSGYPPADGPVPDYIAWDLWVGPSPFHPYNPEYFAANRERARGGNCLKWNMYWDFGSGQIGDMGAHTMDLVWNVLDADLPTSAKAEGGPFNPEVTPVDLRASYMIPANDWRKDVRVTWWQGALKPQSPSPYLDISQIGHGAMFRGSHGYLVCDFNTRTIIPYGKGSNMTYYKPRPEEKLLPKIDSFQGQWAAACKGDLKTSCNFDYNGKMMEMMLLGLVAYQVGQEIKYDGKRSSVPNHDMANSLLSRHYREGWPLEG